MPQQYGPAQPLMDLVNKGKDLYNRLNQPGLSGFRSGDTSWHDDQVRKANEGFRQQADKEAAAKTAAAATAAKRVPKRTATRTPPRTAARPAAATRR